MRGILSGGFYVWVLAKGFHLSYHKPRPMGGSGK